MKRSRFQPAVRVIRLVPVLAAAALVGACGSLDANTDRAPTLATLQGSIINPDRVSYGSGAVRVAVVWSVLRSGTFNVAVDLPAQPSLPSNYTIQLDGPPPAEVMNSEAPSQDPTPSTGEVSGGGSGTAGSASGDDGGFTVGGDGGGLMTKSLRPLNYQGPIGTGSFAVGTVVAYVDRNGNGKLDLLTGNASSYIDEILATNSETTIVYFEGPIPAQFSQGTRGAPHGGYNVFDLPPCNVRMVPAMTGIDLTNAYGWPPNAACPQMADAGAGGDSGADANADAGQPGAMVYPPPGCAKPEWLPITTQIVLRVATAPEISSLACANGGPSHQPSGATGAGGGPVDPSVQPATYPDPCDPNLACAPDGSEFAYATCTTQNEGLCQPAFVSCTSVTYQRPTPTPAGWPCLP